MKTERTNESPVEVRYSTPFLEPVTPYVDPVTAYTPIGWHIVYNVYERLIERKEDRSGRVSFAPALAQKWSISADGLRFRFQLQKEARFASGREITPEAVKFSLERLIAIGKDPPKSIPIARASSRYVPLKEVRIIGPHEVDLIMKERWATTLTGLSTAMCSIVDESSLEMGDDFGHTWLRRHSAGSGAYVIQQISEHRVVLAENRNRWREHPRVGRVVILDGRDPAREEERLRRGRIDVSTVVTLRGLREFAGSGLGTRRIPSLLLPTLTVIEETKGPDGRSLGENRLFAAALKHAIDYDAIAGCFGGWGDGVEPAQTAVLRGMPGYDPRLAYYYKHDRRKARRLLQESGYPRGMEIDLTYWEANWGGVDNKELVTIIHSNLEEIGIRGRIRKYQGGEYFELPLEKLRGVTVSMSGCMIPDPDDLMRRRMTWINVSGHDFEAEKEFVAALQETDAAKRSELYGKLQEKFLHEGPMIYLLTFPFNVGYGRLLRGYTQLPHWGGPDFSRLYFVRSPAKDSSR